ncbi:signal recognition particle-docking protein FtsY, partial [Staphylococcus cohnii]
MSFFKRLKDKFASSSEAENKQEDLEQLSELEQQDTDQTKEDEPKKKPKKLKEAEFDDDGLISIEDFEEIEAQQLGAKFRAGLEKSRENFQAQLNNLIARYRKVDEEFFEALEEMLITADVGFNTVMQ